MSKRRWPPKVITSSAAILERDPFRLYIRIMGDLPKATNKLLGAHWRTKHANAEKWKMVVGNAVENHLPPEPLRYAHIAATRSSYRLLDFDGLVASLKPVIDGLSHLVIEDDRWNLTGAWRVHQEFRPKKGGPLLELWITERKESDS